MQEQHKSKARWWGHLLGVALLVGAMTPATTHAAGRVASAAAPRAALAQAVANVSADLFVAGVTPRNTEAAAGDAMQQGFDVSIGNAGPSSAQDVTFTIPLPPHTTYAGDSIGGVWCRGLDRGATDGALTCTASNLAPGQTVSASLLFTVDADAPTGPLSTTVTVTGDTPDPNAGNNTLSGTMQVLNATTLNADVRVESVSPVSPTAVAGDGSRQGFTIVVGNEGPDTATAVTFTMPLPPHTTYDGGGEQVGTTCSGIAYAASNGTETCTVATLAAHQETSVALMFYVDQDAPAGTISETVSITSAAPDPDPTNNTLTGTMQVLAHPIDPAGPSADLSVGFIEPSGGAAVAGDGSVQGFDVVIHNAGPDTATNITFTVPLPAHTSLVNMSETDTWCTGLATGADSGTETCTTASLAPGQDLYASLGFVIDYDAPGGAVSSTVAVTSATRDPNPGNNVLTENLPFSQAAIDPSHPLADVRIESVTPRNASGLAGDGTVQSFTIAVRNAGPSPASNVVLRVPIPPYTEYAGVESGGMSCVPPPAGVTPIPDMYCTLSSLAPSQTPLRVAVDFRIDWWAASATTDIVSVTSDTSDPNPNNNGGMGTMQIIPAPPPTTGPTATPYVTPTNTTIPTVAPSATVRATATASPTSTATQTTKPTATPSATAVPPTPTAAHPSITPVMPAPTDTAVAPPSPTTAVEMPAQPTARGAAATAVTTPTSAPPSRRVAPDKSAPEPHHNPTATAIATPTPRPTIAVELLLPGSASGRDTGSPAGNGTTATTPTLADGSSLGLAIPADPANAGKVDTITLAVYGTRTVSQTVTAYYRVVPAGALPGADRVAALGAATGTALTAGVTLGHAGHQGERRIACARGSATCRPFTTVRRVQKTVLLYRTRVSARADRAGRVHVAVPIHLNAKGAVRVTLALSVQTPHGTATLKRAVVIAPRTHHGVSRPRHKPAPHR